LFSERQGIISQVMVHQLRENEIGRLPTGDTVLLESGSELRPRRLGVKKKSVGPNDAEQLPVKELPFGIHFSGGETTERL